LCEDGGILIRGTGHLYTPSNKEAEEIEALVRELSQQEPKRAEALKIYYFYPIEFEIKAKRSGYSGSQYYLELKLAHEWVKGYLYRQLKSKC